MAKLDAAWVREQLEHDYVADYYSPLNMQPWVYIRLLQENLRKLAAEVLDIYAIQAADAFIRRQE